jgi:hypothetical protein
MQQMLTCLDKFEDSANALRQITVSNIWNNDGGNEPITVGAFEWSIPVVGPFVYCEGTRNSE